MSPQLLAMLKAHHEKAAAECDEALARLHEVADINLRASLIAIACRAKAYSAMRLARYADMEPRA